MVEEVKLKEVPDLATDKQKRQLIILFYILNLNVYLVSLLSFDNIYIIGFFFLLINSFTFKNLFGLLRVNRIMFWHLFIFILYLIVYREWVWQLYLIIITSIINIAYSTLVLNNGLANTS